MLNLGVAFQGSDFCLFLHTMLPGHVTLPLLLLMLLVPFTGAWGCRVLTQPPIPGVR